MKQILSKNKTKPLLTEVEIEALKILVPQIAQIILGVKSQHVERL